MTRVGQADSALIAGPRTALFAVFGAIFVVASAAWMWGFTVDDALISVRYARNLASGGGYALNIGAPRSDGVTPLPWPLVLVLLGGHDALAALVRARALGLVCGAAAGARAGAAIGRSALPDSLRVLAVVVLGSSLPVAAHLVSGMETAVVTMLATFAATERRPFLRAAFAGAVAAFRPETLPWALALVGLAATGAREGGVARRLAPIVVASAPFAVVVALRLALFGKPVPLAVAAKPSDLEHGLAYVGAAAVVAVGPLVALAPLAVRDSFRARDALAPSVVVAAAVHLAVVAVVGGDWMPYGRLVAPIVPGLVAAACALPSRRVFLAARLAIAGAIGVVFLLGPGKQGRAVMADRAALVAAARAELAGARAVAALDIGWVSAATDAPIVDLAGLTDPEIAVLRGGHTSKAVAPRLLVDRGADVLLVYTTSGGRELVAGSAVPLDGLRGVERALLASELVALRYRPADFLPLGTNGAGYVVLRLVQVPETVGK